MIIEQEKISKRWDGAPQIIRDAVFSQYINDSLQKISQSFHLSDEKYKSLAYLCLLTFLGFIHIQDFYKEIKNTLGIDGKLALDIYQEIDKRIFSSFHKEIEENYLKNKVGVVEESQVEYPEMNFQQQVILKEGSNNLINLKEGEPPFAPPSSKISDGRSEATKGEPVKIEVRKEVSLPPKQKEEKIIEGPIIIKNEEQFSVPVIKKEKLASPNLSGEPAPMIIQEKESTQSVFESKPAGAFKQISLSGFFNAMKKPFSGSIFKTANPVVRVETPGSVDQRKSFSTKNDFINPLIITNKDEYTNKNKEEIRPIAKPINIANQRITNQYEYTNKDIVKKIKPEIRPDIKSEIKIETKPEVKSDAKSEIKQEIKPIIKPEIKLEVKPDIKSEIKPEEKNETKPLVVLEQKKDTTNSSNLGGPSFAEATEGKPVILEVKSEKEPEEKTEKKTPMPPCF